MRAEFNQSAGRRFPDTLRAAGHDGDFSVKSRQDGCVRHDVLPWMSLLAPTARDPVSTNIIQSVNYEIECEKEGL
jgi:hypothetical protein